MGLAGFGAAAQSNLSSRIETIIEALADPNPAVQWTAASALGQIGSAAVPALVKALADPKVGRQAALALGRIGPAAEPAVPALVKALADPKVGRQAASALGQIATSLSDAKAIGALSALREAQVTLEDHTDLGLREHAALVRRAVNYLELQWWKITTKDVANRIENHPYAASIIGTVLSWLALCFGLFLLSPITILKINDFLRPFDFKFNKLVEITVSPRRLLLVGVLSQRPRVLDAWVLRHVGKARKNFEHKRTVEERSVHISVPVHLDKETIPELTGRHLRAVFGTGTGRLLIWGEGGAGKTSIACRIARWAMADTPEQRPAPHRMLPVLIERELDFEVGEGKDPFTETVRGDLEKLIEAQVGDELLAALLKRRRVLVIVDHLSEMTDATRKRVRPDVPNFPAAALVVTSRLEEQLGDVPKDSLKPLRVTGDYLFEFMGAYLKARGVRELFPDREFGGAGVRIAELVGERDVTVLLVKLYLDRLIATKEKGGDVDKEMPGSIPSLMLRYLNDINRAVPEDVQRNERAVHRDAEALAWTCLEERFRPAPARIDEVVVPALTAVNPEGVRERLDYLERRLRLIETVEPERDRVHFALDPVAEYLAGQHVVKHYREDVEAWRGFLARADAMPDGLEAIRSFLLAVRDCCLAKAGEVAVPEFVPDELAERAGFDLERLRQARLQERITRYAHQLKANNPDDRRLAAETLGRIGPAAEPAVATLVEALGDPDTAVREAAAVALGRIGPAAAPALQALVKALADPVVRRVAAWSLAGLGPAAVPVLTAALADPDVRKSATYALGRVGPAAEPAVAALTAALADTDTDVRQAAAYVLERIGPAAKPAVPALTAALADPDTAVREAAAVALRQIGLAAEQTMPS
jgi:HEAT repeat protein